MPMPIRATVLFAAVLAALPARAQFLGFGFESNIELTKRDLEIIRTAVNGQIHGKPVGANTSWSNPESGNFGKIKLLKKFTNDGRHCETVGYILATKRMAVSPEHFMLSSCLQPDGRWLIM